MSTEHHDQHSDDPGPRSDRDPGGTPPAGDDTAREHPHGVRARTPRLRIVAVAAAVLLAGGGGAYWAAAANSGGGHSATGHDAVQPLRFDGPDTAAGVSGGGPEPTAGGPYRLTGTLPGGPSSAAVEKPSGGIGQAQVQHLAQLLGLTGPVTSVQGAWRVDGTPDSSGPALMVSKEAPGAWSYTRLGPASSVRPDGTVSSNRAAPAYGTDSGTPPVSQKKAEDAVAPVLKGLGMGDAALDASRTAGALRTVLADPVVAGLPTHGWATSFEVGSDGRVSMGYGRLSPLVKGATYPVVSAATALKELNARSMAHPDGPTSCRMPPTMRPLVPGTDGGPTDTRPGTSKTVPCLPTNPHPVDVRGAQFGLSMSYVSGVQTLVPAWLFQTQSAGVQGTTVVAQTAVDPKYVMTGPPVAPPPSSGSTEPKPPVTSPPVTPGGPDQPVDPRAPQTVTPTGYRVQGDTLTLVFWGGVCGTYQASADETPAQVRVRITHTPAPPGHMCPMIERSQTVSVTLHQPLGHRTVVNATNGQPVKGQ